MPGALVLEGAKAMSLLKKILHHWLLPTCLKQQERMMPAPGVAHMLALAQRSWGQPHGEGQGSG